MLMPGRYISDTSQHCMTISTTKWVTTTNPVVIEPCMHCFIWNPVGPIFLPPFSGTDTLGLLIDPVDSTYGVMYTPVNVTPGVLNHMDIPVDFINAGREGIRLAAYEDSAGVYKELTSTVIAGGRGDYKLDFTPVGSEVHLTLGNLSTAQVAYIHFGQWHILTTTTTTPVTVYETVCNEDKDKYMFGYNGVEKTNEIAGIGNHYTALFGEYDPRSVWRWNRDPKPSPSISPYATFAGNPIMFKDISLDTVKFGGYKDESKAPMTNVQAGKVWSDMVTFIHKNGVADEYDALDKSPHVYTVYFFNFTNTNRTDVNYTLAKDGATNKLGADIYVNPWQTFTQGNYYQSGIEGILHEMAHAFLFETLSIDEYNNELGQEGRFGSMIETKVIDNFESKYSDKIGTGGRRASHWGSGTEFHPFGTWRPSWDKEDGSMPKKAADKQDNSSNSSSSSNVLLQTGGGDAENRGNKTIDPSKNN